MKLTDLDFSVPLLVACFTEEQLRVFCWNHDIPRARVVRVRKLGDLFSRWHVGRPLLLLPKWYEERESGEFYRYWSEYRKAPCIEVSEDEVQNGTFELPDTDG
jgi:hypothetical protein